jgi:hypothetical protein
MSKPYILFLFVNSPPRRTYASFRFAVACNTLALGYQFPLAGLFGSRTLWKYGMHGAQNYPRLMSPGIFINRNSIHYKHCPVVAQQRFGTADNYVCRTTHNIVLPDLYP